MKSKYVIIGLSLLLLSAVLFIGMCEKKRQQSVVNLMNLQDAYKEVIVAQYKGWQLAADSLKNISMENLDKEKSIVCCQQKEIPVSQTEYQLLLLLLENKGKTVTRRQLLEQVWDNSGNYVNDNTLTVTIKRLRGKLNCPACLKTIRSFGYRMEDTK